MKKTLTTILILISINISFAQQSKLAKKMCMKGYLAWPSPDPIERFEKAILKHLGLPLDTPNRGKHIAKFFNENNHLLICDDTADTYIRENEHILKRSLALSEHDFLIHIANEPGYEDIDWNFYEIVDGKKETMIDYIEKILNDPEHAKDYNVSELKELVEVILEAGGKRGRELD